MKTKEDPPNGYGYGIVEGRQRVHIVKIEPWNSDALCGVQVLSGSIIDESYGTERDVCPKCLKLSPKLGQRQG